MGDAVRWRTYVYLRAFGPRKAATLSKRIGVGETSMLRHLLAMRDVGFVTADDESKPERQRLWRYVPGGIRLTDVVGKVDTDPAAMRRWMQAYLMSQHLLLKEWVNEETLWPTEWSRAAYNYDYWYELTAEELNQLTEDLRQVLEEKWGHRRVEHRIGPNIDPTLTLVYVPANAIPVRDSR